MDMILDFGLSYAVVKKALPEERELRKMPRQYICNVIYTLVGEPFAKWVSKGCTERNENFTKDHGMEIKLSTRVAEAAAASTYVSRKFFSIFIIAYYFNFNRDSWHWSSPLQGGK